MNASRTVLTVLLFSTFLILFSNCSKKHESVDGIVPPKAEKVPKILTIHDHTRIDNYYWLNQRENPKVLEYLEAENDYRNAVLKPTEKLQKKIFEEIIDRIKQEDESVPYFDNGYYYYWRYQEDQEYPLHARKRGRLDAREEIMLNTPEMAKGHGYYSVIGLNVSENNQFLSFGADTVSRRKYTIYFKDFQRGVLLKDELQNTTGYVVWANDNQTVFYTTKDSTLRPYKVWRHQLGTDPAEDVEIYHEKDNTFEVGAYKTLSDKYIVLASYHTLSSEMRLIDADDPAKACVIFNPREKDHEYQVFHHMDKFYVLTNWNAKNFRLMITEKNKTAKQYWQEVIPHRSEVLLENVLVFKNFLVLGERKDGIRQIRIINLNDGSDFYIDFQEEAYVASTSDNFVFDTHVLRYEFTSLTTPLSTFDYDMLSKEKTLLKVEEVGGKFESNNYLSERIWAKVRDSAAVPISLVYPKDLKKDGQNPLLLYGYGSYGISRDPYFDAARLSLLDRGFIFAIAHIRGGTEMGRSWYENGKLLNKKNTFYDFIDCAEFLIAKKYTSPEKLFAMGGSAGGLLMGAVVNMRPDLFKGIIAAVPWVDVVTTMLDESIPLTTAEFDEWGNPKDKKYYDYMLSYSPYDNVTAQDYPALFVTTGLHDSQVQYFEPTKWVAKLRDLKTDNNLIVLDVDMESGHGGTSGRFKRHKRTAMEYAFMLNLLGIKE
jgi:oligopeptidase B